MISSKNVGGTINKVAIPVAMQLGNESWKCRGAQLHLFIKSYAKIYSRVIVPWATLL